MPTETTIPTNTTNNEVTLGSFGRGVLPSLATEFYGDLKRELDIPADKAHKIATAFMADYGRMMAQDADLSYKVSKANKDGMVSLAFAAKGLTKTNMTKSLSLARLCIQLHSLKKEGLIKSVGWSDILPANGENSLYDYVNGL